MALAYLSACNRVVTYITPKDIDGLKDTIISTLFHGAIFAKVSAESLATIPNMGAYLGKGPYWQLITLCWLYFGVIFQI